MADDTGRGAVVITGSSTGIGRATALHLDRLGFRVFAGVRKEADGEGLRAEASESIEPVLLDVTDADQIAAAATRVEQEAGGSLQGLVNNAGIGAGGPLELLDIDDFRRALEVNLTGQVAVTQAFLPQLRPARGRVVFVSSIGGRFAGPFLSPYHASKFGLEAVADSLRQELRRLGVSVSLIEPGSVATEIWDKGDDTAARLRAGLTPEAEEVYGEALARAIELNQETKARAVPAQRVADAITHALTASRPRTRYVVGRDARIQLAVTKLPDRLRDRLVARITGL
jgi:NAD(P)-dependent dehydrogenase (short-subunit alcohol dehydrogenase family)